MSPRQTVWVEPEPVSTDVIGGDYKHSLADISKAEAALGYKPKVDFKEGLRRTVEWYRTRA